AAKAPPTRSGHRARRMRAAPSAASAKSAATAPIAFRPAAPRKYRRAPADLLLEETGRKRSPASPLGVLESPREPCSAPTDLPCGRERPECCPRRAGPPPERAPAPPTRA